MKKVKRPSRPQTEADLIQDAELSSLLRDESPRGQVLISGAYLDNLLTVLLKSWLFSSDKDPDNLFDSDGAPCSSFSAKITLAYRTGLISQEIRDILDTIRHIRNHFAHQLETAHWQDSWILTLIAKIERVKKFRDTMPSRSPKYVGTAGIYNTAVFMCVFALKRALDFCKRTVVLDKRINISLMTYTSIEGQIWAWVEKANVAAFLQKFDALDEEENAQIKAWANDNAEKINQFLIQRSLQKEKYGLQEEFSFNLWNPKSDAEKQLKQNFQIYINNLIKDKE